MEYKFLTAADHKARLTERLRNLELQHAELVSNHRAQLAVYESESTEDISMLDVLRRRLDQLEVVYKVASAELASVLE